MEFEWDSEKDLINREKHKISFELATEVFRDSNRVTFYDYNHSGNEDRYFTIGKAGKVLFVVFTERSEKTRIISARLANSVEKRIYYGNN